MSPLEQIAPPVGAPHDPIFEDLFYDAPVAYHEIDAHGLIMRVNRTELTMLGYFEEEMVDGRCGSLSWKKWRARPSP